MYQRTQGLVDRLFFRERLDIGRTMEQVADTMTTLLDLNRIVLLLTETVDRLLHPHGHALLLLDADRNVYRPMGADSASYLAIPADGPLARLLGRRPVPLTRERLAADPEFSGLSETALASLDALGATLVVPVVFRGSVRGMLALGPKRAGTAYTTEDLRLARHLVNQSAVALENARAYTALEVAHVELQSALRRVQILETIRTNLAKFVPQTVQDLIEEAPEAPAFEKREVDVTVLFVDIAGYTRLSERFDVARVNELVERYFGAFLDEILGRGGDVNETAGDGLMVIFRGPDPRDHARAAVLAAQGVLRRAHAINAELTELSEPIRLHVGVNSGTAGVGATKIEGSAGTRWTYTASGSVTNLAARLAALSEGDAVVVGSETAGRLGAEMGLEDWGERQLRNVDEPVRVFRLLVPMLSAPSREGAPRVAMGRLAGVGEEEQRGEQERGPGHARRPEGFAEHHHAQRGGGERLEQRDHARGGGGDAPEPDGEEDVRERGGADAEVDEQRPRLREGPAHRRLHQQHRRDQERGEREGGGGQRQRRRAREEPLGAHRVDGVR